MSDELAGNMPAKRAKIKSKLTFIDKWHVPNPSYVSSKRLACCCRLLLKLGTYFNNDSTRLSAEEGSEQDTCEQLNIRLAIKLASAKEPHSQQKVAS